MTDTFEFTLNNPLTEEQWDMITDVDFDRTDCITFHTKHGKEVQFTKVIQCKDCNLRKYGECVIWKSEMPDDGYCFMGEREEE